MDKYIETYANDRMSAFLSKYNEVAKKYRDIWDYYDATMPECIASCTGMKKRYTSESWLDGPQGVYWIGKSPKVFIIGREHYGWYGEAKWPDNIETICFAPLEFSYFTVHSMGGYWGVVKDIMLHALGLNLSDWGNALSNIALSNACKCLTGNRTFQWNLHQECLNRGYVEKEISVIDAPLTIMFTRKYSLLSKVFSGKLAIIQKDEEFVVAKIGTQIVIECAHPGRQSNEWRHRLVELAKESLQASRNGS